MTIRLRPSVALLVLVTFCFTAPVSTQKPAPPATPQKPATPAPPPTQKPAAPQKPAPPAKPAAAAQPGERTIGVRGFATIGNISFTANDSFETILGQSSGFIFGGGGQVLLPWGIYVEVGASRFARDGERVFVGPDDEIFPLGIPVEISVTPIEVTAGFRYQRRPRGARPGVRPAASRARIVPYGGLGFSSYGYKETSPSANAGEDVSERFSGFHVVGGVDYALHKWIGVGAEVGWSSIADALGEGGVSAAFDETNLGGTSLRMKISVGR